jgi:hypothetical protein
MHLNCPDPPSRHHLPFDRPFGRPFDRLTVLSIVEGLTVPSKVEGLTTLSRAEGPRYASSFVIAAYW